MAERGRQQIERYGAERGHGETGISARRLMPGSVFVSASAGWRLQPWNIHQHRGRRGPGTDRDDHLAMRCDRHVTAWDHEAQSERDHAKQGHRQRMVPNEATEDRHGTYARLSDRGRRCGKMSHLAIRGGGPGRVECLFDDAMKMFGAAASNGFARVDALRWLGRPTVANLVTELQSRVGFYEVGWALPGPRLHRQLTCRN